MKVSLVRGSGETDITRYCGSLSLSNSLDSLGSTLDFTLVRNIKDDNFAISEKVETGDFIRLEGETEMFYGIVIDMGTSKYSKSISCLDFSFYLNKNKVIRQFKEMAASKAISDLCRSVGVPVGSIDNINTKITKIYRNNTVAEVITDILEQATDETGNKYRMEINGGEFFLKEYEDIEVELTYGNIQGGLSKQESIAEMKNKIIVMSNNQDNTNKLGEASDEASMKRYGVLQDIIEIETKDSAQVRNIAKNKLEESNKVATSLNLEVMGNELLRSGRLVDLQNEEFGVDGKYLIKSCTHNFIQNNHTANIEIEMV